MQFLSDDFLLDTQTAQELYHTYAEKMPILDYHCHVDPGDIWKNRRFENLTQLWLESDHYKWRLMRANGVDERYITGNAPEREKFQRFAETLPRAVGNPLLHWCHLELKSYSGWNGFLTADTAQEVWELCSDRLQNDPGLRARGLIAQSRVEMIGTTDDPCSDLLWHEKLAADGSFRTAVLPTFRPDSVLELRKPGFAACIRRLEDAAGSELRGVEDVRRALSQRLRFFIAHGCRSADHGLAGIPFRRAKDSDLDRIFARAMAGEAVTADEAEAYRTELLLFCAREYAENGIVMQLHYSCLRDPNTRMYAALGGDRGFDSIAVSSNTQALQSLLDTLERENALPKTVLYSLNPADNAFLDCIIGAYQSSELPGKLQHGSAWWFNDTKAGMTDHLTGLAGMGILGNFIGMLTDSRSLLSYVRHAYFRRVLCSLLGRWVENGEYPNDLPLLGSLVEDVCYYNAKRYFQL